MLTNEYVRNLIRVRKETLGTSWEEIAEKADISLPTLYKYIYNQTGSMKFETIVRVMDALGLELTIQLKGRGEKP